jgi:YfiH family protein
VGVDRGDDPHIVLKNREKVADYFGITTQQLLIPRQVHGDTALVVDRAKEVKCDALITNAKNLLIGVNTADCCPILLCSQTKKYIAAIHCGWKGALAGIVENTMKKLQSLGCNDIVCAVGPCIQQKSFEVGDEIISKVSAKYISKRHFDLPLYVCDKLSEYGAMDVLKINVDTFTNNAYFSHRRQVAGNQFLKCGVQFSGIVIVGE